MGRAHALHWQLLPLSFTMATKTSAAFSHLFLAVTLPTAIVLGLFFLGGKYIETRPRNPVYVSVQGETKIAEKPDIAKVTLGVQTGRRETSKEAMRVLEQTMSGVVVAVRELEVKDADVQTSGFSLYPAYDYTDGEQIPRGYEASQNLTIIVRTPEDVGDVISAAIESGANNVSDISFLKEDLAGLRDQARRESIAKAKQQAERLAGELGMRVGDMTGYSEDILSVADAAYGKGGYGYGGMGGGGGEALPIPSGEQEFTVRVFLTYELK